MEKVFWNGFANLWNKQITDRQKIRKPMTVLSVHDGISGFDGTVPTYIHDKVLNTIFAAFIFC